MEFLFLFLGIGALVALTVSSDGGSDSEPDENQDELRVERDADGRLILRGTSGADLIAPDDIQQAQSEIRADRQSSGLSQIQAGAGDDRIFANGEFDPENPRNTAWQDNLAINGGPGNDIILSNGTFSNKLYGGPGEDTLVGVGADIWGGDGDDLILGRSYYLGEEAQTHSLRGGAGDDTIAVFNGYSDMRGGDGSDRFILEFDRPSVDDTDDPGFPLERGFKSMGNVVIRDFDVNQDELFVTLPPLATDNVEIASVERVGADTVITVAVEIRPYDEYPEGRVFRAAITLQNVDVVDDVQIAATAEGVTLAVNAPPVPPTLPLFELTG